MSRKLIKSETTYHILLFFALFCSWLVFLFIPISAEEVDETDAAEALAARNPTPKKEIHLIFTRRNHMVIKVLPSISFVTTAQVGETWYKLISTVSCC